MKIVGSLSWYLFNGFIMYRSRCSSPALSTRIVLILLTNNAGEKNTVGIAPVFI